MLKLWIYRKEFVTKTQHQVWVQSAECSEETEEVVIKVATKATCQLVIMQDAKIIASMEFSEVRLRVFNFPSYQIMIWLVKQASEQASKQAKFSVKWI